MERCGTMMLDQINKDRFPEYKAFREKQNYVVDINEISSKSKGIITIPVVVHVIYREPEQNLTMEQIWSQMYVLRSDFNRTNWDTMLVPQVWKNLIADCEIDFKLANRDPDGNVTSGVTRTQTNIQNFITYGSDEYYKTSKGGHDIWDRDSYLNIWVGEIGGGLYGFSSFPGSPAISDGLVINITAFGTQGTAEDPSDKGRTTTHEVGHWFNLYHIWGDALCGNDFVDDTPIHEKANYDCNNYPSLSKAPCNNQPHGDMFMNFMDYSQDDCMHMFTHGQKARMISSLNNDRPSLFNSNGYTGIQEITDRDVEIFPNPVNDELHISSTNRTMIQGLELYNSLGKRVYSSFSESFEENESIDVSAITKGVYILKVHTSNGQLSRKIIVQ